MLLLLLLPVLQLLRVKFLTRSASGWRHKKPTKKNCSSFFYGYVSTCCCLAFTIYFFFSSWIFFLWVFATLFLHLVFYTRNFFICLFLDNFALSPLFHSRLLISFYVFISGHRRALIEFAAWPSACPAATPQSPIPLPDPASRVQSICCAIYLIILPLTDSATRFICFSWLSSQLFTFSSSVGFTLIICIFQLLTLYSFISLIVFLFSLVSICFWPGSQLFAWINIALLLFAWFILFHLCSY